MPDRDEAYGIESFERLADVLGQGDALKLCREYGGQRLYVPKTIPVTHEISRRIGAAASERLANEFGGDRLQVPMGHVHTARQRREVLGKHLFTKSANELARDAKCTTRYVFKQRAKAKNRTADHDDLFD